MARTKNVFPTQPLREKKRGAGDMISPIEEHCMRPSADLEHDTQDYRQPLPKRRITELGDVATSGENFSSRVCCTNGPRVTKTLMTPAAQRAVEQVLGGKPILGPTRARYLHAKAEEKKARHAFSSTTQLRQDTIEWSKILERGALEAKVEYAKKIKLALELEAVSAEHAKILTEATEKVFGLQQEAANLKAKEVSAEMAKNNHRDILNQLEAQYDEEERISRRVKFDLRVHTIILENTQQEAICEIREQGAFDLRGFRLLQQQLEDMLSPIELLTPNMRAVLSPEDAERAVAAGRAKAKALFRPLEEGVEKIANDLFMESNGTSVLGQMAMPDLRTRLARDNERVVEGVVHVEASRIIQEGKAAEIKNSYAIDDRLIAAHADAVSDVAKCQADLAAAVMQMEAAKEAEGMAGKRSRGGWEQNEAARLESEDMDAQSEEAARVQELVGVDVLAKKEAWDKTRLARAQAKTDFHDSKRRTSVWP